VSISTNDLKNGMALNLPSEGLVTVVEFQHVKPGKGGAFVRTKLKKVAGGAVLERTFRADEKVPLAKIDKREMQYLYREGSALVFMDNDTYDQRNVETSDLGTAVDYLKEGDAAVQGDRVSGARKPATLETGLVVQVPLFVEPGEKIKVDTRTGEYLARA
jgi:elongation factor P